MKKNDERRLLSYDLKDKDWLGEVVDNEDDQFQFRCKVKVFGLFDDLETDDIPWAFPSTYGIFASSDGGFGSGSVPKIGSLVKVRFDNGNLYSPEYYGIQNINQELSDEISDDYEGTHVLAYDPDEELKVIYQKGTGIKIHLKDSHVTINPDTSITIEHSDSESIIELIGDQVNIVTQNEINIDARNEINIDAGQTVNLSAINVNVEQTQQISLGKGAAERLVLGDSFQALFNTHTHISPFLGIPTSPPVIPMTPLQLSGRGAPAPVVKTV